MTSNVPNLLMVSQTNTAATNLLRGSQNTHSLQSQPIQKSNSELLGDLDFGNLSIHSQQGFEAMPSNNMGLLQGNNNLLDGLSASK